MESKTLAVLTLAALALAPAAFPQEEQPAAPMLLVIQEHVKPPMTAGYEEGTREQIALFAEAEVTSLRWAALSGPDLGYVYVVALDGLGGLEDVHQHFLAGQGRVDQERWKAATAKVDEATESRSMSIVAYRPDLSYVPESPATAPGDVGYIHYVFLYAIAGQETKLEEVARRYVAVFREREVPHAFSLYQGWVGEELPFYVVAQPAASQSAFAQSLEEIHQTLGEEAGRLHAALMSRIRRQEERSGWVRSDLAYPPPPSAAEGEEAPEGERPEGDREGPETSPDAGGSSG